MTMTLALGPLSHDLVIRGGSLARVTGSDEVRQRVLVALWHEFGEYFIATETGTPWYRDILGRTADIEAVTLIIRARIQSVPGVVRVREIAVEFDPGTRRASISGEIDVQAGPGEPVASVTLDLAAAIPG